MRFKCNCPDALNKKDANPNGKFLYDLQKNDWSNSFEGIRSKNMPCKHEIAVYRLRKELNSIYPEGIPKGLPLMDLIIIKNQSNLIFKDNAKKLK